jgi:hypothetical protein
MYKRITPTKLNGDEPLINTDGKQVTVLDFWQYAFSNINANVLRGAYAEFLVECAIKDLSKIETREAWGDWDVLGEDGTKIEVKCCSYIQDWDQQDYTKIQWGGLKAKELYYSEAIKPFKEIGNADYKSDVYVLALLKHKDHETLNILDLDQWDFYVLSRDQIRIVANNGPRVTAAMLIEHYIKVVGFKGLAEAIVNSRAAT